MNKDALLATLIGFIVGMILTACIVVSPKIIRSLSRISITLPKINISAPKHSPTPTITPIITTLTIDSPIMESIATEEEILVSGSAPPHALIVSQSNGSDAVTQSDAQGKYAIKLTLLEGKNDVTVTSYAGNSTLSQNVIVYYSQEKL